MAKGGIEIKLDESAMKQAEALLMQIPELARGPGINQALREVGNLVKNAVRTLLPKPGYPGDKPGLKPLRDTVKVKIVNYKGGQIKVMIVGYAYPAGAHGHLVEFGHEKWLWGEYIANSPVDPHPYMQTAIDQTKPMHNQVFINGARKALAKATQAKAA